MRWVTLARLEAWWQGLQKTASSVGGLTEASLVALIGLALGVAVLHAAGMTAVVTAAGSIAASAGCAFLYRMVTGEARMNVALRANEAGAKSIGVVARETQKALKADPALHDQIVASGRALIASSGHAVQPHQLAAAEASSEVMRDVRITAEMADLRAKHIQALMADDQLIALASPTVRSKDVTANDLRSIVPKLREVFDRRPGFRAAAVLLGRTYKRLRDYESAISVMDALIEHAPSETIANADVLRNCADARFNLACYLTLQAEVIAQDDHDLGAEAFAARIQARDRLLDRAAEELQSAIEYDPENQRIASGDDDLDFFRQERAEASKRLGIARPVAVAD